MPRKARTGYKTQSYDLGDDVTVRIEYPADRKPAMMHNDRYCAISTAPEGLEQAAPARVFVHEVGGGPSRSMTPEELAAARERLGVAQPEENRRKPFTAADAFAQAGLNPQILNAIASAAETDA